MLVSTAKAAASAARAPYAQSTLAHEERLIARARFHPLHWALVICLTIATGWLIAPLWWLGPALVRMASTELALTDRRVILKTGWLRRDTTELPLDSVENIQLHQGLIGRALGLGRILIRGAGGGAITTPPVADVLALRRDLEEALSHANIAHDQ